MKRIFKIIAIAVFLVFIGLQFIRINTANPPIVPGEELSLDTVPPDVSAIISRSCADCHSNNTIYPWYSQISPFSWFLAEHIKDGRRELNLSVWNTYDSKLKERKLGEICEQVQDRAMPLPSYLWIHRDAVMSDAEIKLLCDWAESEAAKLGN